MTPAAPVVSTGAWLEIGGVRVRFTGRREGDLGHAGTWVAVDDVHPDVEARRRAVLDRPWSWVRQVHGDGVVVVDRPGGGAGETGDALVSTGPGPALAILTADCAPIALVGRDGVYGAVHGGWRGLIAGVVERAADVMRGLGAGPVVAALGPCIHAECYEFSEEDLALVAAALGGGVRSVTAAGRPALDVPAAVRVVLDRAGIELVHDENVCTGCSPEHFSHRARSDRARQAVVVHEPARPGR